MENKSTLNMAAGIFVGFAILCFLTALALNSGKIILRESFGPEGGVVGPIEVKRAKTILNIYVKQDIKKDFQWSAVTGNLLDKDKNYLFSFGKEFYKESGYDEGHWTEEVNNYNMKVTVPDKGKYYLEFESELSQTLSSNIYVKVSNQRGSAIPGKIAGILAMLIGIGIFVFANPEIVMNAMDD